MAEKLFIQVQMLHRCDNYKLIMCILLLPIFIMSFCPIAHHLCVAWLCAAFSMLEYGVCELAHSFFHLKVTYLMTVYIVLRGLLFWCKGSWTKALSFSVRDNCIQ